MLRILMGPNQVQDSLLVNTFKHFLSINFIHNKTPFYKYKTYTCILCTRVAISTSFTNSTLNTCSVIKLSLTTTAQTLCCKWQVFSWTLFGNTAPAKTNLCLPLYLTEAHLLKWCLSLYFNDKSNSRPFYWFRYSCKQTNKTTVCHIYPRLAARRPQWFRFGGSGSMF